MKTLFILLFCVISTSTIAQVGINTTTPSNASVLHVAPLNASTNTYGGFLPPRVSLAQRNLIPVTSVDDGLMVYLIEGTKRCIQVYNATANTWEDFYCMPLPAITYVQDFELTPTTPTLTYSGGSGTFSSGNGNFPNTPLFSEGSRGYQVNNTDSTISFDAVDTSSANSVILTFDLASFSTTSGNGSDLGDEVEILVSTDNVLWSSEITINGMNNAKWDFTGTGQVFAKYDGNEAPINFTLTAGGNVAANKAYTKITLSELPKVPTLYLRIRLFNNIANELWVIDNVKLKLE